MQYFQTDISWQMETDTDGSILDFLHNVKGAIWGMDKTDSPIFKNRSDINLVESDEDLWIGPTPCQDSKDIQSFFRSLR